jgi:hypothetical protein
MTRELQNINRMTRRTGPYLFSLYYLATTILAAQKLISVGNLRCSNSPLRLPRHDFI